MTKGGGQSPPLSNVGGHDIPIWFVFSAYGQNRKTYYFISVTVRYCPTHPTTEIKLAIWETVCARSSRQKRDLQSFSNKNPRPQLFWRLIIDKCVFPPLWHYITRFFSSSFSELLGGRNDMFAPQYFHWGGDRPPCPPRIDAPDYKHCVHDWNNVIPKVRLFRRFVSPKMKSGSIFRRFVNPIMIWRSLIWKWNEVR